MELLNRVKFLVALLFISLSTNAQWSWNVKAGVNISRETQSNRGNDFQPGFMIGVGAEYSFNKVLSLHPSLLFVAKSSKGWDSTPGWKKDKYIFMEETYLDRNYLQIPVLMQVRLYLSKKMNLVVGAGPYIGYAISSKQTFSGIVTADSSEGSNTKLTVPNIDNKPFDLGLSTLLSLEYKRFMLSTNADIGLSPTAKCGVISSRNLTFGLSLGYHF
ncbi:MAG: PorT family protein [Bacteroides sp.]|nr:PorT family protein [Bacteroides sp.]